MAYRIEIAKQGRAVCRGSVCKSENVKINKGELRLGVFVDIGERQGWQWRHWSCVTPQVIQNIKNKIDDLPEGLDGYSEISPEDQKRIETALTEGHVADGEYKEDFMELYTEEYFSLTSYVFLLFEGDISLNRLGAKKTKKSASADKDSEMGKEPKKRKMNNQESDAPVESVKRGRGRLKKIDLSLDESANPKDADDEATAGKRGRGRPKKSELKENIKDQVQSNTSKTPLVATSNSTQTIFKSIPLSASLTAIKLTDTNSEIPKKRGRGRPRKDESPVRKLQKIPAPPLADGEKRGRGRPRKYISATATDSML
ncbi:hypothetical protein V1511DRAFT_485969 [Dipodascopsis uninucleata]